ncbi:unnamed protein product [Schistosoma mattheei]|uniref:Tubby C-terminal domain-containing protein n=1 Tax=Schistosoma mattheei TaxID=31246 RepID=A0AA85BNS2_9TREM|nr:unnamed protein product [Schistosoma mattheei]
MKPAPQGVTIRCRITRDKRGVDHGIFPSYYLHLEKEDCKFFLLAARRRKRSTTSNYVISCDATNLSRDAISFAGKLRSNFLGTHFTVYGCESKLRDSESLNSGDKVNDSGSITTTTKTHNMLELAAIIYDTNVLGFKGPRRMTIILPRLSATCQHFSCPGNDTTWLIDSWRRKDIQNVLQLQNKNPVWNEETQSYVLNFHGRVTQASVKNFQIVHRSDEKQRELLRNKQRQKYAHQVLSLQKRTESAGISSCKANSWRENKLSSQSALGFPIKDRTDENYYAYDGPQSCDTSNPDDFPTSEVQVIHVLTKPTPLGQPKFDQTVRRKPNSEAIQDNVVDSEDYKSTDSLNNLTITRSSTMLSSLDQDTYLASTGKLFKLRIT